MPFDKIVALVSANKKSMPASVSLTAVKGGRPRCFVTLGAAFTLTNAITEADRFDVLLGTGTEKGLLRLKRNSKAGVVQGRKLKHGTITFVLGYIERFGTEPEPKCGCNVEMIDADTVEIVLPKWAEEQDC